MVLVGACAVLAACGGGGSSGSTVSSASSGSSAPSGSSTDPPATTVPEPVETTVPASTSATTTSTTSTTTTLAPTTTLSEEQASIAAAERTVVDAIDALTAASVDPSDPSLRERIKDLWADPSRTSVLAVLDELLAEGMVLQLNNDPASNVQVVGESTLLDRDHVEVTYCRLDSDVIVMLERVGDLEVVVDDDVFTRIWKGSVERVDDAWRLSGAAIVAEADGEVPCEQLS
jgi:hypothetical protein